MTNKISNVNTTDSHNKVYMNETHLRVITIKHKTIKKQVLFKFHFSIFCFYLKSIYIIIFLFSQKLCLVRPLEQLINLEWP